MAQRNFHWLDYGRFLSALAVMLFHYCDDGELEGVLPFAVDLGPMGNLAARHGHLGVDAFFVVSGFAIALTVVGQSPGTFARKRFVRLWPTFFLCMSATAFVLTVLPEPFGPVSTGQYVANISMVPEVFGFSRIDDVYWTLARELFFYALVFGLIVAGNVHRLEAAAICVLVALAAGEFTPLRHTSLTDYWPLFAAGILFARVQMTGWSPIRVAALILALGVALVQVVDRAEEISELRGVVHDPVIAAWVTVAIFVAFCAATTPTAAKLKLPHARALGLATYPLYLLHNAIGLTLLAHFAPATWPLLSIGFVAIAMIGLSLLVVAVWEKRLAPVWLWLGRLLVERPIDNVILKSPPGGSRSSIRQNAQPVD